MTTVKIYGASDDLIEIESANKNLHDEFNVNNSDRTTHLKFSEGTVLSVKYSDGGCWIIELVEQGTATYSHIPNSGPDSSRYSDVVILEGSIDHVYFRTLK